MAGRKNRKLNCQSKQKINLVGPVLVMLSVVFMNYAINFVFDKKCSDLTEETSILEKQNNLEESNYERELSRWNGLRTPHRLKAALHKHCLDMDMPSPDRVVKMDADGKPRGNPTTLTRAMSRLSRVENTASVSRNTSVRRVRR